MSLKDITLLEWLTLAAIVTGPILAVLAGRWLQGRKEKRERKDKIFRILMATRKLGLRQDHIEALNMIDVEFTRLIGADKAVREKWKRYLNHLGDRTYPPEIQAWGREKESRFNDLLLAMGKGLGYSLNMNQIEAGVYVPVSYGEAEEEQTTIRKEMKKLLKGETFLRVAPAVSMESQPAKKVSTEQSSTEEGEVPPTVEDYLFK